MYDEKPEHGHEHSEYHRTEKHGESHGHDHKRHDHTGALATVSQSEKVKSNRVSGLLAQQMQENGLNPDHFNDAELHEMEIDVQDGSLIDDKEAGTGVIQSRSQLSDARRITDGEKETRASSRRPDWMTKIINEGPPSGKKTHAGVAADEKAARNAAGWDLNPSEN